MLSLFSFEELGSTQEYALSLLKSSTPLPFCVLAQRQTQGRGSRGNTWESAQSAILFSFAFDKNSLPSDLPLQSLSIYVGCLMEQFLNQKDFDVWIKWPNDLYLQDQKIGGIITQSSGESCICGIGINVFSTTFASLQTQMNKEEKEKFVRDFLQFFFTYPTWGEIFSNYKLKFYKNYPFSFHYGDEILSFKDALLCKDGAIVINHQKFYSLR